jgi:DNA-binding winged helix-turn-helix (wHTH) protein
MVKAFGAFEFDDRRRTLMRSGRRVRISGQAVDLLTLLLERPGELVTRDEIRIRLWPDQHVEFDHSLDVVISRLRASLGDRSGDVRYVETVPRKGYRFVELVTVKPDAPERRGGRWRRRLAAYAAIAILAAAAALMIARTRYGRFVPHQPAVAPATRPR